MMLSYLEILRIPNAIMSIVAVIVSALLIGFFNPIQIAIASLAVFLISGAGMAINDYFDYEADKINRPKRPIPSGRISKKKVLIYSFVLFVVGNSLAFLLNFQMLAIAAINTALLLAYSVKLKKVTLIGNLVVGYTSASIFLFASLLSGGITYIMLILFMLAFAANIGREIVKTMEDVDGDRKIGAKTLPIVAGKNFSSWVAMSFIIIAVLFSPLPYILELLSINYVVGIIVADALFVASCFVLLMSPRKSQKLMKIAMFVTLIAFLAGSF